jgi:hypothetical protein
MRGSADVISATGNRDDGWRQLTHSPSDLRDD